MIFLNIYVVNIVVVNIVVNISLFLGYYRSRNVGGLRSCVESSRAGEIFVSENLPEPADLPPGELKTWS